MATLAQLQAEPWWGREIVTAELDWAGDELCRRTGRPRGAAGTKGDEFHLYGGHRSQEWILNSAYCTSRNYTVQSGLIAEQARHIGALDFVPGAWGTAANRALMVAQTGRLMAEMRASRLEGVRELYGTLDGRTVTGWDNVNNRTVTSDDSHLDHWHLTFDRRRLTDRTLMERIVAVALGEEDDMATVTQADWDALIWRIDAILYARKTVAGGPYKGEPVRLVERLDALEAKLADPVDEAALGEALRPYLKAGVTLEEITALLASVRLSTGA